MYLRTVHTHIRTYRDQLYGSEFENFRKHQCKTYIRTYSRNHMYCTYIFIVHTYVCMYVLYIHSYVCTYVRNKRIERIVRTYRTYSCIVLTYVCISGTYAYTCIPWSVVRLKAWQLQKTSMQKTTDVILSRLNVNVPTGDGNVAVTLLRELLHVRLDRMPVAQVSMLTSSEPSWVTRICSRPSNPSCAHQTNTCLLWFLSIKQVDSLSQLLCATCASLLNTLFVCPGDIGATAEQFLWLLDPFAFVFPAHPLP